MRKPPEYWQNNLRATIQEYAEVTLELKKHPRLNNVAREILLLHTGPLKAAPTGIVFMPGAYPIPQTHPLMLLLNMRYPNADWRKILATEILLYIQKAYGAGHVEAVLDARKWCEKYNLREPVWLIAAPTRFNRRGKRSVASQETQFRKDSIRFATVVLAARKIAAERTRIGYRRGGHAMDKYALAKEWLENSWANTKTHGTGALKESYKRFNRFRDTYYLSPAFVMELIKVHAPTVLQILS